MKLVSWNVQWGRDAGGRVDLDRTLKAARRLADFDVICMQEITRGFGVLPGGPGPDQFAEIAQALPGYTVLDAIGADLPSLDGSPSRRQFGNAIATRLPVSLVLRHSLPWPADASAPSMQRVALEAVVETSSGPLRILVTHLEFYSLQQRLAQVDELRRLQLEAVRAATGDPGSAKVAGAVKIACVVGRRVERNVGHQPGAAGGDAGKAGLPGWTRSGEDTGATAACGDADRRRAVVPDLLSPLKGGQR